MWVMAVVVEAPCQCLSPCGNHTMSPARISCFGPPHCCTKPEPDVTMRVWPTGCVCQAERAPGSNVTCPPDTRDGSIAGNRGSTRTVPVKNCGDPLADGCDPPRVIFRFGAASPEGACACTTAAGDRASSASGKRNVVRCFMCLVSPVD